MRRLLFALPLVLAGCGPSLSDEERIDRAIPVSAEVAELKQIVATLVKGAPGEPQRLEQEYQTRRKVRALECAHGYSPSRLSSDDSIREAFKDRKCFTEADAKVSSWLSHRRVGALLASAPLRPIPASAPTTIDVDEEIGAIQLPDAAGVAVVSSSSFYRVIDLSNGAVIRYGESRPGATRILSANGRLFATHGSNPRDTDIVETETGKPVLSLSNAEASSLRWLEPAGFIHRTTETHAEMFVDLSSGVSTKLALKQTVDRTARAVDAENEFVLLGHASVARLRLERSPQGWEATVVSEERVPGGSWALNTSGPTSDGRFFAGASDGLAVVDLKTLELRKVTTSPLRLGNAQATPDPDKLLVQGFFTQAPSTSYGAYLYSLADRTIAPVDKAQFPYRQLIWAPSVRRLATFQGRTLIFVESVPAGDPMGLNEYIEKRLGELESMPPAPADWGARTSQALRPAPASSAPGAGAPGGVYPGAIAELSKDAIVEGVGVYQGGERGRATGAPARTSVVHVLVMPSSGPLVLVLAAYEPVRWVLSVQPGAKLAAVLSSGYEEQQVLGAGDARVVQIGRRYAYERNSREFADLEAEVARWTGKRIGTFQGRYEGTTFTVGR